jgi:hypothetical protein
VLPAQQSIIEWLAPLPLSNPHCESRLPIAHVQPLSSLHLPAYLSAVVCSYGAPCTCPSICMLPGAATELLAPVRLSAAPCTVHGGSDILSFLFTQHPFQGACAADPTLGDYVPDTPGEAQTALPCECTCGACMWCVCSCSTICHACYHGSATFTTQGTTRGQCILQQCMCHNQMTVAFSCVAQQWATLNTDALSESAAAHNSGPRTRSATSWYRSTHPSGPVWRGTIGNHLELWGGGGTIRPPSK